MASPPLTLGAAIILLGRLNITIERRPAEYRVNYRNGHEGTAHYVESLAEAIVIGGQMAAERPAPSPAPPRVKRLTRRQIIKRHNQKWGARLYKKNAERAAKAQAAALQTLTFRDK